MFDGEMVGPGGIPASGPVGTDMNRGIRGGLRLKAHQRAWGQHCRIQPPNPEFDLSDAAELRVTEERDREIQPGSRPEMPARTREDDAEG